MPLRLVHYLFYVHSFSLLKNKSRKICKNFEFDQNEIPYVTFTLKMNHYKSCMPLLSVFQSFYGDRNWDPNPNTLLIKLTTKRLSYTIIFSYTIL